MGVPESFARFKVGWSWTPESDGHGRFCPTRVLEVGVSGGRKVYREEEIVEGPEVVVVDTMGEGELEMKRRTGVSLGVKGSDNFGVSSNQLELMEWGIRSGVRRKGD